MFYYACTCTEFCEFCVCASGSSQAPKTHDPLTASLQLMFKHGPCVWSMNLFVSGAVSPALIVLSSVDDEFKCGSTCLLPLHLPSRSALQMHRTVNYRLVSKIQKKKYSRVGDTALPDPVTAFALFAALVIFHFREGTLS